MPLFSLSTPQIAVMQALVGCGVRFLAIGGKAANYHGCTRRSDDLDLVYNNEPANVERLKLAPVRLALGLPQNLAQTIETLLAITLLRLYPEFPRRAWEEFRISFPNDGRSGRGPSPWSTPP